MKIGFKTVDYLHCNEESSRYYLKKAKESNLSVLDYADSSHLCIEGYKRQFFKYYISTMVHSIRDGQKVSNELKRIISVIFWR